MSAPLWSGDDAAGPGDPVPARLLLLADGDDVLIAACRLDPGPHSTSTGEVVIVTEPVELGHKVAARAIADGEPVVRYGVPIGLATATIERGAWVHTHNLASSYLATFAHRGGQR